MDSANAAAGLPEKTSDGRTAWGVALGGGGGRTFAHLGVLRALADAGLRPDGVAGSSMGAVLGAHYAWHGDLDVTEKAIREYFAPDGPKRGWNRDGKNHKNDGLHRRRGWLGGLGKCLATASVSLTVSFRRGLLRRHPLYRAVERLFPEDLTFEDLKIPFACVALDLNDARLAVFDRGPLVPALKAGVAVGLVFAPYRWDGVDYVDAAPVSPVPVRACRSLGCRRVLAVDLCAPVEPETRLDTGFDVVRRIIAAESKLLADLELVEADQVVRPATGPVFWGDLSQVDAMAREGLAAGRAASAKWRAALEEG